MSYQTLLKLLAVKALRIKDGNIHIFERCMVVLPAEMLIKFQEIISKESGDEKAAELMYEAGTYQTLTGSTRYHDKKGQLRSMFKSLNKTGDPSIEMGREVLKMTGMGDTEIVEVTKGFGRIVVKTKNSPIAEEYLKTRGKSKAPICHYLRGIMNGVIQGAGQKGYRSRELECRATGKCDSCVFEFIKEE
ncbi:MAG: V4R domain-containing protein [Candidatus Micrarchaeota archaeon]